jgi:hypothetical protein
LLLSDKQPYQRTTLQEQGLTTGLLALLLLIASDAGITASNENQIFTKVRGGKVQGTWMPYRIAGLAPAYCFGCGRSSGCIALIGCWMPCKVAGFRQTATPKDYTTPKNRD